MKLQKLFLIKSIMFMLILLICLSGFQVVSVEKISGVIQNIDKNSKSIVVNGTKVLISSSTKIVDGKGKILRINDLTPNSPVAIEGVHRSNGFFAAKIVVTTPKKGP